MPTVPRLLIVEDQPELARLLAAALGADGFEVRVASGVAEARAALAEATPQALLLDLLLPDGLGFDVAREAKARAPSPVVVAVSGVFRQDPTVTDALRRGLFDAFFDKPFALRDVTRRLRDLLDAPPAPPDEAPRDDEPLRLDAAGLDAPAPEEVFDRPEGGLAEALRRRAEGAAPVPDEGPETATGTLGERGVPRLINAFHTSGESGELHLKRGKVHKVVYFHEGLPAFAASNLRRDRFDELLLRRGTLDEAAVRAAAAEARRSGRRVDRVLLEQGLLSASRHRQLVTDQVKEIIFSLFPWRDGTWRTSFQDRAGEEPVRLRIAPADLILEGVHTLAAETLEGLLPAGTRLAPAPAPAYELYELSLTGEQALVVSRLDGTRSVEDVAGEGWLPPRETFALLYGLLCLEVVEDASLLLL